MNAATLDAADWNDTGCAADDADGCGPKRERFRQSLGKVYRARAAERRSTRVKAGHGRRRHKRMTW